MLKHINVCLHVSVKETESEWMSARVRGIRKVKFRCKGRCWSASWGLTVKSLIANSWIMGILKIHGQSKGMFGPERTMYIWSTRLCQFPKSSPSYEMHSHTQSHERTMYSRYAIYCWSLRSHHHCDLSIDAQNLQKPILLMFKTSVFLFSSKLLWVNW